MRKLFVSVPMNGRNIEDIRKSISKMHKIAELFTGEELELIDSLITGIPDGVNNTPMWCLGESIKRMSDADVFIGVTHSWHWRGCEIESGIAERYGLEIYCVQPEIVIDDYRECVNRELCGSDAVTPAPGK